MTVAGRPGEAGEFRVTVGAETYELQFFVFNAPAGYKEQIFPCSAYTNPPAGEPDQYLSCVQQALPDGVRGVAYEERGTGVIHRANAVYRGKLVEMSVYANRNGDQGRITNREMLDALTNAELSAAYHEWMTHPAWLSN